MSARLLPALAAALAAATLAASARADVFSPGDLSRPHASLDGLANCTKCHAQGGQEVSQERCLACHGELQARVQQGKGFHGRLAPDKRACQLCHHEHQGRDLAIVDWGQGGKKRFDHARAGWTLDGKHRSVECARCHDPRLVKDEAVRKVIDKGRASSLGAPVACAACHFDEHRGQLGADCARCHSASGWKPAKGFDHARAAYRLDGKHTRVACQKCHPDAQAPEAGDVAPLTKPIRPALVAKYKPLVFQSCQDCHKDPHQARFGAACASCHVTADWKKVHGSAKDVVFHEKTRYPLRGAHVRTPCAACHGPSPGRKAVYRGLAFARCTDCHYDAHLGQLRPAVAAASTPGAKTCDRCHTVDGYTPVTFELEDHQKLAYRLEGGHRTVACQGCHPKDPRLEAKFPAAERARLQARGRTPRPSLVVLRIPDAAKDCRTCHRDPHAGQFQARTEKEGCTACHGLEGWRKVRFDHARDSRFKLDGKHQGAACASCHRPDPEAVRYRPLPLACAGCHADVHAGQFAVKGQTDCRRCHGTTSWKEGLRFDHAVDSRFKLEGKHKPLACAKCHGLVAVAGGVEVRRYKPLPLACEGCHADFHKGAFRGYVP